MCSGDMEYNKVSQALMQMFGGDHRPNPKDLGRLNKDEIFYKDADDEVFYEEDEDEYYDGYDEDYGDASEDVYYEDEIPEDVENAADQVEDA